MAGELHYNPRGVVERFRRGKGDTTRKKGFLVEGAYKPNEERGLRSLPEADI
jgi:hypothetical protein